MSRWAIRLASLSLLLALPALVGCPSGGGVGVSVYPSAFSFGADGTAETFTVTSLGSGEVDWHIENLPAWLTANPTSGTAGRGGQVVALSVERDGVTPGSYSGKFDVVSGDSTISVPASMKVDNTAAPAIAIDPVDLNLGESEISGTLSVDNTGGGNVTWSVTEDIAWLELSPQSGSVGADEDSDVVTVTVDRSGLAEATHTGTLHFTSNGGNVDVPVTIAVGPETPVLSIAPLTLEFTASTSELPISITNSGTGLLNWTLDETVPWLSLSSTAGALPPATVPVTVTVDRTGLEPGTYNGTISATSDGGTATINVHMVVAPPLMDVSPTALNFSTGATRKLVAVSNLGSGTVDWSIDTSAFPAWLSVSATSGTVGTSPYALLVNCDRTGQASGNYTTTFEVVWTDGPTPSVAFPVTVNMTVAPQPILTVEAPGLNGADAPLVAMGTEGTTANVLIRNTGSGTLNWALNTTGMPDWITLSSTSGSITVTQGSLITVTVNRANMATGGNFYQIPLTSNGGNTYIEVTMQVPLSADIIVDPSELKLGVDSDIGTCYIANSGDSNTILNYRVSCEQTWVYFSPATNTSIGTSGPIKDWKRLSVAVDRSQLGSSGGTGLITIRAYDASGQPITTIEPKYIKVSVESPPLSFEVAKARTRFPSLVRFVFTMRDSRNAALMTDPSYLEDNNAFHIFEDGVAIESTETNRFVRGWEKLKVNVVLMFDISGSMLNAVQQAGIGGADPLLNVYREEANAFLDSLPAHWKVSLMEFHERHQTPRGRVIHDLSLDRDDLKLSLANYLVSDYGATELLPAALDASTMLVEGDSPLIPFDDADVRAVIMITDGRRTTPPGDVDDTCDTLYNAYTRIYTVGWGQEVDNEPLARLSSKTGGHFYSTRADANGHVRQSELHRVLQQLSSDMRAYRLLQYTTLNEEDEVGVRVNGFFDEPNDTPNAGVIQGTFSQQLAPADIVNDTSLGQISMRSTPISGGNATVFVHADYVPRNVNKFLFRILPFVNSTVSVVPEAEGGLLEGWNLQDLGGGQYRFDSPGGAPLPYGAFGDLLEVSLTGVVPPAGVQLDVNNAIYVPGNPQPKYFVFPDYIPLNDEPNIAPAFPNLALGSTELTFPAGVDVLPLTIWNFGGAYPQVVGSEIYLSWRVADAPDWISVDPHEGAQVSVLDALIANVTVDRGLTGGATFGLIRFDYGTGNAGITGSRYVVIHL